MMARFASALTLAALLVGSSAGVAAAQTATVAVVHGIPGDGGFPVDISVNGACVFTNVQYTGVIGPVALPAGGYEIAVYPSTGTCSGTPALGPATIPLAANTTTAIVAHLTAAGAPTVAVAEVDVRRGGPGFARVNVFHLAQAPAVDVELARAWGRSPLVAEIPNVANGQDASTTLRAGAYEVAIVPAGGTTPVAVFPAQVLPNRAYGVFAVGSLAGGSFTLVPVLFPVR
jgi:hypothetical protein